MVMFVSALTLISLTSLGLLFKVPFWKESRCSEHAASDTRLEYWARIMLINYIMIPLTVLPSNKGPSE